VGRWRWRLPAGRRGALRCRVACGAVSGGVPACKPAILGPHALTAEGFAHDGSCRLAPAGRTTGGRPARRQRRIRQLPRFAVPAVPALSAGRRPARGHPPAVRGHRRRPDLPDPAGRDRLGQDLHDGQRDRPHGPAGHRVRAQQDAGRAAVQPSSASSFRATRWSTSSATTTTTSPRPMCRSATCSSRRTARSTSTSSRCACRPPRACWSGATWSSWPPSAPSTASATRADYTQMVMTLRVGDKVASAT
jgi:hypothetical protein